jgi:hypothetical protein
MMMWLARFVVAVCVAFLVYFGILLLVVPLLGLIDFPIAAIVATFLVKIALVLAILVFFVWLFVGHSYWPLRGRTF